MQKRESFFPNRDSEFVIGLVAPVGVNLSVVRECIQDRLKHFEYKTERVHLSHLLRKVDGLLTVVQEEPEFNRVNSYMDAGNEILTPQHLQRLWSDLQTDGLAPRTVIQVRAILRTALSQAVKHSLTHRNVAALSDPPKATPFKPMFLDPKQAELLLTKAKGHHLEALVTLALTTGMRIGEILGLTWGDIDLEKRSLRICQQQQRVGKELLTVAPKTERSARTIQLTQMAVEALNRHRQTQIDELREGIDTGRVMTGRVFTNEKGDPVENGTVLRQFQRLVKDAGLPRMRLHDLRHSCATLLLTKGIHPRVVMELLGHSTIAMTMNVYSHVVPAIAREAADAMDSVFSAPAASSGQG